jgi:hypothetical protein
MTILRVDCVTPANASADQPIEGLGGENFYHPADTAIRNILNGVHIYYAVTDGDVALIDVRKHPVTGKLFLQIVAGNHRADDLLHLPECRELKKGRAPRPLGKAGAPWGDT